MFYGLLRDRWLVNQFQLLLSKVLISLEEFYGWLKSFFPDLKAGVTLANSISFFFFFWKTSSFIELRKILMRGFMICFIWFTTLACILSKPGPLFVFNALHYMLPKTCSSLKGCDIVLYSLCWFKKLRNLYHFSKLLMEGLAQNVRSVKLLQSNLYYQNYGYWWLQSCTRLYCVYLQSIKKMQLHIYKFVKTRIDKNNNVCDEKYITTYTNLCH